MLKNKILLLATIIILGSCSKRIENKGYIFDQTNLNSIAKGITSKNKVIEIMGYPNWHRGLSDYRLIYQAEEIKHFLFFKPKIISRKVLILDFDEENILSKIQELDLRDENKEFKFAKKYTAVYGHKKPGFFKALFSNIGQVRPQ